MAAHSSILAWKIPWTVEPVGYLPRGLKESDTTERDLLLLLLCHKALFICIVSLKPDNSLVR